MKSFKSAERHALPNQVVSVVETRTFYNPVAKARGANQYQRLRPFKRHIEFLINEIRLIGEGTRTTAQYGLIPRQSFFLPESPEGRATSLN